MGEPLTFRVFHIDEKLLVFPLRASGLWLIYSMMLDGRKDIQSVESAWSILNSGSQTPCPTPSIEK